MAEFVKKTLIGYSAVPGGQSDYDCSHVILTKDEYDKLLSRIRTAELNAENIKVDANRKIKRAEDDVNSQIKFAEQKAADRIAETENLLKTEKKESEYQRGLNENLLRISKERANADRKLKPKKEHTGYIVLSSRESEYRYKEDKRHWNKVMLWETVLQSPYSVEFTEAQARKQMKELFKKDELGSWMIYKIGITAVWIINYEDMIEDKDYPEYKNGNVIIRIQLRANYTLGYWEIILQHTKPLKNVPKDMMKCNYA